MKADLAKERLEVTRQLAEERERGLELNETMTTLKQQVDQYQVFYIVDHTKCNYSYMSRVRC